MLAVGAVEQELRQLPGPSIMPGDLEWASSADGLSRSLRQGTNFWTWHMPQAMLKVLSAQVDLESCFQQAGLPPQRHFFWSSQREGQLHLAFIARPANDPPVPGRQGQVRTKPLVNSNTR